MLAKSGPQIHPRYVNVSGAMSKHTLTTGSSPLQERLFARQSAVLAAVLQRDPNTDSQAQRRSPRATLTKLTLREEPVAAEAPVTVNSDQPDPPRPAPLIRSPGSLPINIPARRHENTSRPTTPLTAREEKAGSYFPFVETPHKPQISQSLRPSYTRRPNPSQRKLNLVINPPKHQYSNERSLSSWSSTMPPDRIYTPSSPLSPRMAPASSISLLSGARPINSPRRGKDLQLPPLPLPRFHPAVYQSPTTRSPYKEPNMHTPAINQMPQSPRSPQLQKREASDAQQKLKHYQREMIANATRASAFPAALGKSKTPKAPHIDPLGSPGPTTPLFLEEPGDYMTAGSRGSLPGTQQELIDKIIRSESERRMGLHSGSSSPSVSPAGGP